VSRCLLSGCCWGLVTKDHVEYVVGRHSFSVVELVVVVSLCNCVTYFNFMKCHPAVFVKYFNSINNILTQLSFY
jgi:hypothetical protein